MGNIRRKLICRLTLMLISLRYASALESGAETSDKSEMTEGPAVTTSSLRRARYYRRGYNGRQDDMSNYQDDHHNHSDDEDDEEDHHDDMKAMSQPKVDYWGGYYDFLINEGSYKFWAVFQLATAALLIYSGFAALYYAKVNPPTTDDDLDDLFRRRRKRRSSPPSAREKPFSGLDEATFQRIIDAIPRDIR